MCSYGNNETLGMIITNLSSAAESCMDIVDENDSTLDKAVEAEALIRQATSILLNLLDM